MKKVVALIGIFGLLLAGCSRVYSGSYSSVKPHVQTNAPQVNREDSAANRQELYEALSKMVEVGEQKAVIYVPEYDPQQLEEDLPQVRHQIENLHPVGAYAVDWMSLRLGKSNGQNALTVHVNYIHDRTEIRDIQRAKHQADVIKRIQQAMDRFGSMLVLRVDNYTEMNLLQIVEDYALNHPQKVMEMPGVLVEMYPDSGTDRVIEMKFSYQTDEDTMRSMQEQVAPVFERARKAALSSKDGYRTLYDFLMKGYNHHITPSITPSYSLLKYGVGDSRAFAQVYAAMCRDAGLECLVVNGTRNGVSHYWNIIREGEVYYHLDLMGGRYALYSSGELKDYVWDYAAYPTCGLAVEE